MLTVMVIPVLVFVSHRAKCAAFVNFLSEDLILISSKGFGFGSKILTLMVLPSSLLSVLSEDLEFQQWFGFNSEMLTLMVVPRYVFVFQRAKYATVVNFL